MKFLWLILAFSAFTLAQGEGEDAIGGGAVTATPAPEADAASVAQAPSGSIKVKESPNIPTHPSVSKDIFANNDSIIAICSFGSKDFNKTLCDNQTLVDQSPSRTLNCYICAGCTKPHLIHLKPCYPHEALYYNGEYHNTTVCEKKISKNKKGEKVVYRNCVESGFIVDGCRIEPDGTETCHCRKDGCNGQVGLKATFVSIALAIFVVASSV